jgi:lipopolysaccharide biosynthesis glycosyltransferase
MSKYLDIAFGLDVNYVPHAAATIASVVRRTPGSNIRFIILHDGIDAQRMKMVETISPKSPFVWIGVSDDDLPPFAGRHLNRTTLFRLGLEKLAPVDCGRVIYLDADVTVLADIRELWDADLEGLAIAAVEDAYQDPAEFGARWCLGQARGYFNAGVLLIDLNKVRSEKLFLQTINFIAQHGHELPNNDQDALNFVFWNRWQQLNAKWNVQRKMSIPEIAHELPEQRRLKEQQPSIVHFEGPDKPWLPGIWHPWAWIYWDNLARTPFKREIENCYGVKSAQQSRLFLRWLRRHPLRAASPWRKLMQLRSAVEQRL